MHLKETLALWRLMRWPQRFEYVLSLTVSLYALHLNGCQLRLEALWLQDLTADFAAATNHLNEKLSSIFASLNKEFYSSEFGVGSFRDKPLPGLGDPDDYCYKVHLPLAPLEVFRPIMLQAGGGGNSAHNQLDALARAVLSQRTGFSVPQQHSHDLRIIILATNSMPNLAGAAERAIVKYNKNNPNGPLRPSPANFVELRKRASVLTTDVNFGCSFVEYPTANETGQILRAAGIDPIIVLGPSYITLPGGQKVQNDQLTQFALEQQMPAYAATDTGLQTVYQDLLKNASIDHPIVLTVDNALQNVEAPLLDAIRNLAAHKCSELSALESTVSPIERRGALNEDTDSTQSMRQTVDRLRSTVAQVSDDGTASESRVMATAGTSAVSSMAAQTTEEVHAASAQTNEPNVQLRTPSTTQLRSVLTTESPVASVEEKSLSLQTDRTDRSSTAPSETQYTLAHELLEARSSWSSSSFEISTPPPLAPPSAETHVAEPAEDTRSQTSTEGPPNIAEDRLTVSLASRDTSVQGSATLTISTAMEKTDGTRLKPQNNEKKDSYTDIGALAFQPPATVARDRTTESSVPGPLSQSTAEPLHHRVNAMTRGSDHPWETYHMASSARERLHSADMLTDNVRSSSLQTSGIFQHKTYDVNAKNAEALNTGAVHENGAAFEVSEFPWSIPITFLPESRHMTSLKVTPSAVTTAAAVTTVSAAPPSRAEEETAESSLSEPQASETTLKHSTEHATLKTAPSVSAKATVSAELDTTTVGDVVDQTRSFHTYALGSEQRTVSEEGFNTRSESETKATVLSSATSDVVTAQRDQPLLESEPFVPTSSSDKARRANGEHPEANTLSSTVKPFSAGTESDVESSSRLSADVTASSDLDTVSFEEQSDEVGAAATSTNPSSLSGNASFTSRHVATTRMTLVPFATYPADVDDMEPLLSTFADEDRSMSLRSSDTRRSGVSSTSKRRYDETSSWLDDGRPRTGDHEPQHAVVLPSFFPLPPPPLTDRPPGRTIIIFPSRRRRPALSEPTEEPSVVTSRTPSSPTPAVGFITVGLRPLTVSATTTSGTVSVETSHTAPSRQSVSLHLLAIGSAAAVAAACTLLVGFYIVQHTTLRPPSLLAHDGGVILRETSATILRASAPLVTSRDTSCGLVSPRFYA